ncbi:MAG: ribonuclease E activity regulator RraA [Saprospiraceae bacterium]|nr:ribonuclease E activity regulator RraA [Saprospiraceae bacterium]
MNHISTADLWDQHHQQLRCADPIFYPFGMKTGFAGEIVTVKVFEDNSLVRKTLETAGTGKVLVVDGGGSLRCALLGDRLASLAINNGWQGIIIYGCIRDRVAIDEMNIGVRALNTCPVKSIKRGIGETNISVRFAGIVFEPGHFVYADADGILVSEHWLLAEAEF